ncbi:MAG: response regulator transcription factor [Gammaproteobacteria bacterium]|nr:response regulator transcription factor [Gammaproteobacteria bacterium]
MRLLLVEDEPQLRIQLAEQLEASGYVVDQAGDGTEGLYFGTEYPLDLAVVDLGLPDFSGVELIRRLRSAGRALPVLVLTARDRWQDKVEALEAGADDYLVKPFQFEELQARLNALLRRAAGWSHPLIQSGPVEFDSARQQVRLSGVEVELTGYEYRLLEYLMMHLGEPVSKSSLMEHLYPDEAERDSNVIEVFIRRLRQKLDGDGTLHPIETLRGRGYRWSLGHSDR